MEINLAIILLVGIMEYYFLNSRGLYYTLFLNILAIIMYIIFIIIYYLSTITINI